MINLYIYKLLSVPSFALLMSLFSPPIINDYINQLEALKRDGKENSKESLELIDKYYYTDNCKLNESLLDIASLSDNSWLLNRIGFYYYFEDISESISIEWYMKSANLDNSDAMCMLGWYCEKKNYPKAIEWYMKSSNLGNSTAMSNLGLYYHFIEKDYPKAIEWYIKSANLGNESAMSNLGFYYEQEKDYQNAIYWYAKSTNCNNGLSYNNLKLIKIKETDYDYIFELLLIYEEKSKTEKKRNKEIKDVLLNKLPSSYVFNKQEQRINNVKSIKTQGIDKVLINSIYKHF